MLDAFRTIAGGKSKLVQKQVDDLELLITTAREERSVAPSWRRSGGRWSRCRRRRPALRRGSTRSPHGSAALDDRTKALAALDQQIQSLKANADVKQSLGQSSTLKTELTQIRALTAALNEDYAKMRETSREAREDTSTALSTNASLPNGSKKG